MISAGEVGAVFKIVDEASPVLKRLMDQFNELQAVLDRTKLAMRELTFPPGLNASIAKMGTALKDIGTQAEAAAGTVATNFGEMDGSVGTTTAAVTRLAAEIRGVAAESRALGSAVGGAQLPGGAPAQRGAPRTMRERVAGSHGRGIFHAHESIGPIGVRGHDDHTIAAIVTGIAGYEAFKYAANLAQIQNQLSNNGVSREEIEKATRFAYGEAQKYGQPVTDVLQTINELRNPLNKTLTPDGGVESSMAHVAKLGSAMVVLRAQDLKGGTHVADELYDLTKSAEFRNAISDTKFDKAIDAMIRADVATGGRVSPREFFQMSRYMKAALPGLSDDFLYNYAPELAQEFKGSSAGNYLASLYQQIVSGQMRTTGIQLLDDLGEIDRSKVEFDHNGRIVRMKPGADKLGGVFKDDPGAYAANLVKEMVAHGITKEGDQRDYMSQIFGNRNAAQMIMTLAYQYARLNRGAEGIKGTLPIDVEAKNLLANDPWTKVRTLQSSYENLMTSVGQLVIGPASSIMSFFTRGANAARGLGDVPWTPKVHADGGAYLDHFTKWLLGDSGGAGDALPRWSPAFFAIGDRARSDLSLFKNGYTPQLFDAEQRREHARGAALSNLTSPPQNTTLNLTTNVQVDGRTIASIVEKYLVNGNTFVNSASGHDGRMGFAPPDAR